MPAAPGFHLLRALGEVTDDFASEVRRGFASSPKTLPCRFLYDEEGSRLFEAICELPEYYVTRAEHEVLVAQRRALARRFAGAAIIELGSGNSAKTEALLAAMGVEGAPVRYVPIDICAEILEVAGARLTDAIPSLEVRAIAAEYGSGLELAVRDNDSPRVVAWLGSNVGNFRRPAAAEFLASVRARLGPADALLLGADLRKDKSVLEAAYDDPAGVTAAFNKNLLARINRELGADFDLDGFLHVAEYDEIDGVVRMHLESLRQQTVRIEALGESFDFAAGERVHTEDSHKYSREELDTLARDSGFVADARWSDSLDRFSLEVWLPA